MHKIQFPDGSVIDNLELNGNNHIPQTPIDAGVFDGIDRISIIDQDGNVEDFYNFKIVFTEVSGKQSFVITSKSKEEIENEELKKRLADLTEIVLLGGM